MKKRKIGPHPKTVIHLSVTPSMHLAEITTDPQWIPSEYSDRWVRIVPESDYRKLMAAWRREQESNAAIARVAGKLEEPDPRLSGVKRNKCNCERVYGGKRK